MKKVIHEGFTFLDIMFLNSSFIAKFQHEWLIKEVHIYCTLISFMLTINMLIYLEQNNVKVLY